MERLVYGCIPQVDETVLWRLIPCRLLPWYRNLWQDSPQAGIYVGCRPRNTDEAFHEDVFSRPVNGTYRRNIDLYGKFVSCLTQEDNPEHVQDRQVRLLCFLIREDMHHRLLDGARETWLGFAPVPRCHQLTMPPHCLLSPLCHDIQISGTVFHCYWWNSFNKKKPHFGRCISAVGIYGTQR